MPNGKRSPITGEGRKTIQNLPSPSPATMKLPPLTPQAMLGEKRCSTNHGGGKKKKLQNLHPPPALATCHNKNRRRCLASNGGRQITGREEKYPNPKTYPPPLPQANSIYYTRDEARPMTGAERKISSKTYPLPPLPATVSCPLRRWYMRNEALQMTGEGGLYK